MINTNKNDQDNELELLLTIESNENSNQKKSLESVNTSTVGKIKKYNALKHNKRSNNITENSFNVIENIYQILIRRKSIIVFIVLIIFLVYINSTVMPWYKTEKIEVLYYSTDPGIKLSTTTHPPLPPEFLVWSDKCKIPNIDPYDTQVMHYFKRQKYEACSKNETLTTIQFNSTTRQYTLNINEKLKVNYGLTLDCCFQDILRNQTGGSADKKIAMSECVSFQKSVQISNTTDNILVKCKNNGTQVYIHGHPMMPERADIRDRLDGWNNDTKRPPSVLMIGIDSISRINLLRAMPKTAQILNDNEWFEMSGYNKMEDNTFPNLMAILTGFNISTAYNICDPTKPHKLDNCPMIWKLFREHGYVTAYAEDEVQINTFNYVKVGFAKPPVDYYLRPFMIAAEKYLPIRKKSGLQFCLGYLHSADYVFNYAIELATRYKTKPYFGLFWSNSFSHGSINDCSSMDNKVAEYLQELSTRGILNESVVIFLSDHGMRIGPARKTVSGFFEERLPFMYIWLPQWLKTNHPEFVNALRINKNRLTNPYDIHMTLKNLLELSDRNATNFPNATDCPNCQSLLRPVPYNRSCEEIAITDHWCTCVSYQSIDIKSDLVQRLASYVVGFINNFLQSFKNSSVSNLCAIFHLHNIIGAYRVNLTDNPKNLEGYRLIITTAPGDGLFEATIHRKADTNELAITGSISRLNIYAEDSKCISDNIAKKYCYCSKNVTNGENATRNVTTSTNVTKNTSSTNVTKKTTKHSTSTTKIFTSTTKSYTSTTKNTSSITKNITNS